MLVTDHVIWKEGTLWYIEECAVAFCVPGVETGKPVMRSVSARIVCTQEFQDVLACRSAERQHAAAKSHN